MESMFVYETAFGKIGIGDDGKGLFRVWIGDEIPVDRYERNETPLIRNASKQLDEYFAGKRREFDLPLVPRGTDFQKKVWEVLRTVPYGETWTYKAVAEKAGSPRAFRAVGMANHHNPLPIIIPCHRVVGSNGSLVGFGYGLPMKEALLSLEKNAR